MPTAPTVILDIVARIDRDRIPREALKAAYRRAGNRERNVDQPALPIDSRNR